MPNPSRRKFLATAAGLVAAASASGRLAAGADDPPKKPSPRTFKLSLAQWSLNKQFKKGELDPKDFAAIAAKDHGFTAIEYVNQFYFGKIEGTAGAAYVKDLRKRADDHGVTSLLIMCDQEGLLGDADLSKRRQAVVNHHKWADAAAALGCHSIRVNALGDGESGEIQNRVAESVNALADYTGERKLDVLVENHGGYSSDGAWVAKLIELAAHPRVGTLPDFGNFKRADGTFADRYEGVRLMMPFARAVSAKSHEFDEKGEEVRTDYPRMMKIVLDAGYSGYVGIEYEGEKHSAADGIRLTKSLLEKIRDAGA